MRWTHSYYRMQHAKKPCNRNNDSPGFVLLLFGGLVQNITALVYLFLLSSDFV
ncbi:hypothetical protein PGIGA_G00110620 [Pangasianodon gigas]|uniref:Uncharacterized protein n=1 Tax=Pangasianodon gigas TaxID=30993 RepID=A0ACC5W9M9_PANGG|nr:hypothetical protein [Pangasianodon gigas]